MAASQVKMLLDELAKVLAEMGALEESENSVENPEGDESKAEPMTEEQEEALRSLADKAEKIKERIKFHERMAEKEAELRAVLERAAPVKKTEAKEEAAVQTRQYAIPKAHGNLKAFKGQNAEERAYRAGMHL